MGSPDFAEKAEQKFRIIGIEKDFESMSSGKFTDEDFYVIEHSNGHRSFKKIAHFVMSLKIGMISGKEPRVVRQEKRRNKLSESLARGWPRRISEAVADKTILLRMTPKQVRASWGAPESINRSVGSWGVKEQWVYSSTYLYFDNGKLSSWQEFGR